MNPYGLNIMEWALVCLGNDFLFKSILTDYVYQRKQIKCVHQDSLQGRAVLRTSFIFVISYKNLHMRVFLRALINRKLARTKNQKLRD